MKKIFLNGNVFIDNAFRRVDFSVEDNILSKVSDDLSSETDALFIDLNNCCVLPGFVDVHVHLREPGFLYKEDIRSGTLAASGGGYTAVCSMPNLNPVPDNLNNLNQELEAIKKKAVVKVFPYGSITIGEEGNTLSDLQAMSDFVIAFSDDGRGIQDENIMREAMIKARSLNKIIVAHCEDNNLVNGGCINDCKFARENNLLGINNASEYVPIQRDLRLAKETNAMYHICHISTKESVELIRKAKEQNINVTCETAPHYLLLNDSDLIDDGRYKMNPPLRSKEDQTALIEALKDGTIDMIATDHAPHSKEEKSKGLKNSLMGIVGLETAFPMLYTKLVKTGIITLNRLLELMSFNPAKRFGIENKFEIGEKANFTVFDLDNEYTISSDKFLSKGKSTPFEGERVFGKCKLTVCDGEIVWRDEEFFYV